MKDNVLLDILFVLSPMIVYLLSYIYYKIFSIKQNKKVVLYNFKQYCKPNETGNLFDLFGKNINLNNNISVNSVIVDNRIDKTLLNKEHGFITDLLDINSVIKDNEYKFKTIKKFKENDLLLVPINNEVVVNSINKKHENLIVIHFNLSFLLDDNETKMYDGFSIYIDYKTGKYRITQTQTGRVKGILLNIFK